MKNQVYHNVFLLLLLFRYFHCLIVNPAIGILTESNLYLAQIIELNSTIDDFYLIYHHNDPVYSLQSLTSNNFLQQIYFCSTNIIYKFDLQFESSYIIPLLPIDDTPCQSNLIYLSNKTILLWNFNHQIIQLDFLNMSKEFLWNSTLSILNMIYNETIENNLINFYLSIKISNNQSSILHCQSNNNNHHLFRISPYQSCFFIDNNYHEISTLAINNNHLYVGDRIEKKIFILTLSSNYSILTKTILPLNTNIIADIQSMFIYNNYLIWLTISGHIRIVSLETYKVRNLFWFNEQLRTIQLISFFQWPNRTSTTKTTIISSSSSSTTQIDYNPWKTTTYVTSILLGLTLFLLAILITYIVLSYRFQRSVPNSFTNIFHILHNRAFTPPQALSEDSLT